MARFDLSNDARAQIRAIGKYIEQDNPVRAVSYIDELMAACQLRAEMPNSGQKRPELDGCPNSFIFGSYVVLYDILADKTGILVLGVLHERQDISQKFRRSDN